MIDETKTEVPFEEVTQICKATLYKWIRRGLPVHYRHKYQGGQGGKRGFVYLEDLEAFPRPKRGRPPKERSDETTTI